MELFLSGHVRTRYPGWEGNMIGGNIVPKSQAVAQYLPYLRRYARALTGSQHSGDAYVVATLEALVADPSIISEPCGARVAIYRLFTKIWNSISLNEGSRSVETNMPGEQKLAQITPMPRQAF